MRARTAEALAFLCWAMILVTFVPMRWWRNSLGGGADKGADRLPEPRRLARHVERAAARLLPASKCLPRAMALSWMLRRRRFGHVVKIAVRPSGMRDSPDGLHAWVEAADETILGELPGPWVTMLSLGGGAAEP